MCDHKWVPYVMLTVHPKEIVGASFNIYMNQILSLVTTKVKCVECGEVKEVSLGEAERKALSWV